MPPLYKIVLASLFHREHKLFCTVATQHLLALMMYNFRTPRKQNPSFYVPLFSPSVFSVGVNSRLYSEESLFFLIFLDLVCVDLSGEKRKKKKGKKPHITQ